MNQLLTGNIFIEWFWMWCVGAWVQFSHITLA